MDKTIVGVGSALVALGVGFWAVSQWMSDLHSAYLIGGYLWAGLGAITLALGLKKKERLQKMQEYENSLSKNALGV